MLRTGIEIKSEILRILPKSIRNILDKDNIDFSKLVEIRLRKNMPVLLIYDNKEYYIGNQGNMMLDIDKEKDVFRVSNKDVEEVLQYISNYSMYAFENDIKQGFITILGGHRVGLAGKAVIEDEKIKMIKHISCINIRVSHQVIGCAKQVIPFILNESEKNIYHTLIISPPRGGKTTLLRDIVRMISNGVYKQLRMTVGVVDERSEIAACYNGIPQNDVGIRTDVMDCCPKGEGMLMLIRAMSPNVIAVDEIGSRKDYEAVEYVINCGCKLIATVHGNCIEDIRSKPILGNMVREKVFQRYIVLDNMNSIGKIKEIFDMNGNVLYLGN